MKRIAAAIPTLLLVAVAAAQDSGVPEPWPGSPAAQFADSGSIERNVRPEFSDYALEALGAYGCGCGAAVPAFVAFGLYGLSTMDAGEMEPGVTAALLTVGFGGLTLGSAAAANWIGNRMGWSGSFRWSWGLSALSVGGGYALAAGVGYAARNDLSGSGAGVAAVLGYAGMLAAPAMAAVGYNIGAKRREPLSWQDRIDPPSFTARVEAPCEPGEQRAVTLDAKLLTLRF